MKKQDEELIEKVLKEIKNKWNDKTQIGFSELALKDAIKITIKQKESKEIK